MTDQLPRFRYHPDPIATGSFEPISTPCAACGRDRGWIYVFGTYGARDLRDAVCPWCIADGSAAEMFDVVFTDLGVPDGSEPPEPVSPGVVEEIERRTPGFSAWQQERWLFHCGDGAAFLGPVGWERLEQHPDATADVTRRLTAGGLDPADADMVVASLDADGLATGYLFRCLHCDAHLAYADMG